jgi:hypothetical protein
MTIEEFLNYNPNCIVCKHPLNLYMEGMMTEEIDEHKINTVCLYGDAIKRKKYLTFAVNNFACLQMLKNPKDDFKAWNTDKYSTFTLYDNNIVEFDTEFAFTLKFTLSMICSKKHYSYSSRRIKVSHKSPDITKGYQQIIEEISSNKYAIVSDRKKKQTAVFPSKANEPVILSFKEISEFPVDDMDKFNKKLQNLLVLA